MAINGAKAGFPLKAILLLIFVLMIIRYVIVTQTAVSPLTATFLDALMIVAAVTIAYGVFGMVRELNLVVAGLLVIIIGEISEDWPLYWSVPGAASAHEIWSYVSIFIGTLMILYGLLKFQEKYKFK